MVLRAAALTIVCGFLAPPAFAIPPAGVPHAGAVVLVAAPEDPAGAHAAIAQAQERLAEVDATISVLQESADTLVGAAQQKAKSAVTALRTIRDDFRNEIKDLTAKVRQMTVAQVAAAKALLTRRWTTFERTLDAEVAAIKLDVSQKKALIQARIKAEQAYWQSLIDDLQAKAASVTAQEKAVIEAKIAKIKARAAEAETRVGRLRNAGQSAWSALKQGFVNSRQVIDDAYRDPR